MCDRRARDPKDGLFSMLFRTSGPTPGIGIDPSSVATIWGLRGGKLQLGLSAPPEIPIRREEPSERIEAGQRLPCDVRRLIEDALSGGRPLREIEDYLDWLDNT